MFIYNLKLNSSILFKILLGFIIAIVISLCGIIAYKIYKASVKLNDDVLTTEFTELNSQNYASVLQSVHNNIDNYVGQKIKFSGFIFTKVILIINFTKTPAIIPINGVRVFPSPCNVPIIVCSTVKNIIDKLLI